MTTLTVVMEMAARGYDHKQVQMLVGITHRQLDVWDRQGFVKPSLTKRHGRGKKRLYSFKDLIALRTAKFFRDIRVPLRGLKKSLHFIQNSFPDANRSISGIALWTDREKIFLFDPNVKALKDTLKTGRLLLSIPVGKFAEDVVSKALDLVDKRHWEPGAEGLGSDAKSA